MAPTEGSVRLANGWSEFQGGVEIFYNGSWFGVCDYSFGMEEGDVVCRQLGFDSAVGTRCCSNYFYSDVPGILSSLECTGYEDNLLSCEHSEVHSGECDWYRLAGVVCRSEYDGVSILRAHFSFLMNAIFNPIYI